MVLPKAMEQMEREIASGIGKGKSFPSRPPCTFCSHCCFWAEGGGDDRFFDDARRAAWAFGRRQSQWLGIAERSNRS